MKELSKKYDHALVEDPSVYQGWIEKGYFTAGDKTKTPYTIVIPPPNVTGMLHLGHTWDTTLQDILSRYKRLQGFDVLWLPGMDHAGIATQAKVDARLREEGISRYDLGREGFLQRAWDWKEEYASTIRKQWAGTGLSLDYSRERFTLDDGLSHAVRKIFSDLYHEGLIYQGERIINWDPQAMTALSNIEVIHKEIPGKMYYFKYTIEETGQELVIATTRPETMFADQAIFVHPDDERYKDIVGLHAINPANGESLPIMADDYIDMSFGTAVMKCTPAHDPNDFALAKKYNLAMPICMNPNATMNEMAGKYEGMDRFECRDALVKDFEERGVVDHIEEHPHQVGHSERTGVIVEPYLSKQWFVRMKPLAQAVMDAEELGEKIEFIPPRFHGTFRRWLENIEDWCISRQLWWGHRIPAWTNKVTGEIYVGETDPEDPENWIQDEDVLDTWFSSALWPFSTLGWPENTEDLQRYFPTDVLVTGYDIIFFWVARMIFSGCEHTGKTPFHTVLIHGLVRDNQGRKMSKSLGNGIDPLEMIDKYGCDALRMNMVTGNSPGNDMRFYVERCEAMRNFANKLWNASRYVLMNLGEDAVNQLPELSSLEIADKWVLSKLNTLIAEVTENLEKYELGVAIQKVYDFIWDTYCDWYIELTKARLYSEDTQRKQVAIGVLVYVLDQLLRLLHPFMPFITEEIWQSLPHEGEALIVAQWPQFRQELAFKAEEDHMESVMNAIRAIRARRTEMNVPPSKKAALFILTSKPQVFAEGEGFIQRLAYAVAVTMLEKEPENLDGMVTCATADAKLYIPMGQLVDVAKELERISKELDKARKHLAGLEAKLSNEKFTARAPEAVVNAEREKAQKAKDLIASLEQSEAAMKKL